MMRLPQGENPESIGRIIDQTIVQTIVHTNVPMTSKRVAINIRAMNTAAPLNHNTTNIAPTSGTLIINAIIDRIISTNRTVHHAMIIGMITGPITDCIIGINTSITDHRGITPGF
jgi:hypothetical protein